MLISGIILHTDTLDALAMPLFASACQILINISTQLYNRVGGCLNGNFMMKGGSLKLVLSSHFDILIRSHRESNNNSHVWSRLNGHGLFLYTTIEQLP